MTRPPNDPPPRDVDGPAPGPHAPPRAPADASGLPPDAPATGVVDAPGLAPGAPRRDAVDASGLPPDAPPAEDVDAPGLPPSPGAPAPGDAESRGGDARDSVRAPRVLAGALVALLVALATADAIAVVSDLWAHPTFRQAARGEVSFLDADDVHEWQSALGIAQVALTVVVAIAWLAWFRRAYATAGALAGGTRRAPSWAVWAWFVPVLNLFRPKAMTDEAFARSGDGVPAHVHWWWGLTLASVALSVAALVATPSSPSAGDLADATLFHAVADLAGAGAALLGIAVVTSLTSRQHGAARRRGTT